MKLPLHTVKRESAFSAAILDANNELVAVVSDIDYAAQIVSAVNRHQALVKSLEMTVARLETSLNRNEVDDATVLAARRTLLEGYRDALPYITYESR